MTLGYLSYASEVESNLNSLRNYLLILAKGNPVDCVWFKKDLRVHDHQPLNSAIKEGRLLIPVYLLEPAWLCAADTDALHWKFIKSCLIDLQHHLAPLNLPLFVIQADAVSAFAQIHKINPIAKVWSHQETGNNLSYQRDLKFAKWCAHNRVHWCELPNNAVVRALKNRDDWSQISRQRLFGRPLDKPVFSNNPPWSQESLKLPNSDELGISRIASRVDTVLRGGEARANTLLQSFLAGRGHDYNRRMSSPNTAWKHCSRLSPFLANGCISIRSIMSEVGKTAARIKSLKPTGRPISARALSAFSARCHWHCHFIQKLECQPSIEWKDFHPAFEGLRDNGPGEETLERFLTGNTGFPYVDACMRSLRSTGWINFRMRAMLTSFAAYHLWIDWRRLRDPLARMFIDYEPGIHYSQLQMQSGVTGINTLRIYNPVKQGIDHDADGAFIRRWVPELNSLGPEAIHSPWDFPLLAPSANLYPRPIVDPVHAIRNARAAFAEVRRHPSFKQWSQQVYDRHGSRKRPQQTSKRNKDSKNGKQMELSL